MDDEEGDEKKAAKFRSDAVVQGLILVTPDANELRFTFPLTHGTITTSRHWGKLLQLLVLAKECWGDDGDFDELCCMAADRASVYPSIDVQNLAWSLDLDVEAQDFDTEVLDPDVLDLDVGVQFIDWLGDHVMLPLALLRAQDPS